MRWSKQMDDQAQTRHAPTWTATYVKDGNPDLKTAINARPQPTAAHRGASPGQSRQINNTRPRIFARTRSNISAREAERRRLESEDRELNKVILARAQKKPGRRLIPLAEDKAAQGLLARMREHSEKIRRSKAQNPPSTSEDDEAQAQRLRDEVDSLRRENETFRRQPHTVYVPPPPTRAETDIRRLMEEVENLRRENDIFRILQSQAPLLDDAPPPYTRTF